MTQQIEWDLEDCLHKHDDFIYKLCNILKMNYDEATEESILEELKYRLGIIK